MVITFCLFASLALSQDKLIAMLKKWKEKERRVCVGRRKDRGRGNALNVAVI